MRVNVWLMIFFMCSNLDLYAPFLIVQYAILGCIKQYSNIAYNWYHTNNITKRNLRSECHCVQNEVSKLKNIPSTLYDFNSY